MRKKVFKVVGVSFKNDDGSSRQDVLKGIYDDLWTEGRESEIKFRLSREPDNKYDSNAVAVLYKTESRYVRVGYIPKDVNEQLGVMLAAGSAKPDVSVDSMGLARNGNVSLSISVMTFDRSEIVVDDRGRTFYY